MHEVEGVCPMTRFGSLLAHSLGQVRKANAKTFAEVGRARCAKKTTVPVGPSSVINCTSWNRRKYLGKHFVTVTASNFLTVTVDRRERTWSTLDVDFWGVA